MCSRVPVIVILGATGSGKSKLGIEIARRFGGEILSADSMQAYKGLDIITNKVTAEERAQARHHLLEVVTPPQPFSVVDFRDAALPIVERLLQENKVPIVVGGTNYYIESLLWRVLVAPEPDIFPSGRTVSESECAATDDPSAASQSASDEDVPASPKAAPETDAAACPNARADPDVPPDASNVEASTGDRAEANGEAYGDGNGDAASDTDGDTDADAPGDALAHAQPLLKRARLDPDVEALPSPELHRQLQKVDPDMARRLHPNNRRRIIRSLQVFEQLGRPHSEVLREQRLSAGGSALGGPLRYTHSAIFWLQCDQATLDARLDARVDDMLERGLVAEMLDFHVRYNAERVLQNKEANYTKGIFQSIGFKEFHEYLLLEEAEREGARGRRMFQEAVAGLKTVTRRYARKQVRWVINRFLRQPQRQVPPVYAFDTSDPSQWDDIVYKPAVHVVDSLLNGMTPTDVKPLPLEEPLTNEPTSFHCEICDRVFIGDIQWKAHITSKKHKRVLQQKNKIEKMSKAVDRSTQCEENEKCTSSVQTNEIGTHTTGSQTQEEEEEERASKRELLEP